MNKQELQKAIDEANIEVWTKELEKPEHKRWCPNINEEYYFVSYWGDVLKERRSWNKLEDPAERYARATHFYKTEEEATKERDRRFAEAELLELCDDVQSNLYKIKKMWHLQYNLMRDSVEIVWGGAILSNPYIFATKESAQNAIDTLGVEKLKLIFRVT